ncbi:hypothetical protein JDS67_12650 [Bacillus cereus]|nr:hypothetical protein [Bacillus cereus]
MLLERNSELINKTSNNIRGVLRRKKNKLEEFLIYKNINLAVITLHRKGIFKKNTYQVIMLEADSDQKTIQITQEYFKTQEINEINMTYDECITMEELVKKRVHDSLKKQSGLQNDNTLFCTYEPMLDDDENRIVTVVNNANRNLSVQIINKYVVNVSETINKEYKTYTLKINLKELQYIFTKLYFFFNRRISK